MNKTIASIGTFFVILIVLLVNKTNFPPVINQPPSLSKPLPVKPDITNVCPGYQDYPAIQKQLEEWKQQASILVSTGSYGKSSKGNTLSYIRITSDNNPKKKVLITACIHGNEPLAASVTMAVIGMMLSTYTVDPEVTELINTRDIYFIPVISPDSYPHSRYVDGVDPNRDFSDRSTPSIAALQKFHIENKFNAMISCHTFGRIFLIPYGDKTQLCPNNSDYENIIGKMQNLSKYKRQRACEMYNQPIFGTEIDWFYRHNCFSIVAELGDHQRIPSITEIKDEFNRTYRATLLFIKEAPLVTIK